MPNWCANILKIRHADPAKMAAVKEAFKAGNLLNYFVPVPPQLYETDNIQSNVDTYGYESWYEFCIDNWGTKWDVGDSDSEISESDGQLTLRFYSAWSPPARCYDVMNQQGFHVEGYYYEPGMAFCGMWINGQESNYAIPADAAQATHAIPPVLNDYFDIINQIEWI
jgi:hypothetical protein